MKGIIGVVGLSMALLMGGCDNQPADATNPAIDQNDTLPEGQDVPEGGPESGGQGDPEESLYEGAVPESEEAESGERADGDW